MLDILIESNYKDLKIQYVDATLPESRGLVELYKITSVPTMIRLSDSEVMVGFKPEKAKLFLEGSK
jgi:hypothetical protein